MRLLLLFHIKWNIRVVRNPNRRHPALKEMRTEMLEIHVRDDLPEFLVGDGQDKTHENKSQLIALRRLVVIRIALSRISISNVIQKIHSFSLSG